MPLAFNTIRARLLSGFLLLIAITIVLFSLVYFFYQKIDRIDKVEHKIDEIILSSMNVMSLDEEFLRSDIRSEDYFLQDESPYASIRDSIISEIFRQLYKTKNQSLDLGTAESYNSSIISLEEYNETYVKVLELYKQRGYKDYGIEGEMRHWAHLLEDSTGLNFEKEWILSLRRFEKDYIIRKDSSYVKKFEAYASKLIRDLKQQEKHRAGVEILELYRDKFRELVRLENELGIDPSEGKKHELFLNKISALRSLESTGRLVSKRAGEVAEAGKFWIAFITLLAIIVSILVSIWLSRRFSLPVQRLSENMNNFLYKDWKADLQLQEDIDIKELKDLTKSYKKLVSRLKEQYEETREKSEELDVQNSKLLKIGEEMDQFVQSSSAKLRAPMNSLKGMVELFKLDKLDIQDPNTITMIEQSIAQIEHYIIDVNEYVELRKDDLKIEDFNAGKIIEKIIKDKKLRSTIPVKLRMEMQPVLNIRNDPKRFELIMNHLFDNAFQYYDRDLRKLNLLVSASKSNGVLMVNIHDDGIGINENHLNDVFKMFFRASHYSQGPGLGLYIAKASLKTMSGSIELKSKKGEGTEVSIRLPDLLNPS